MNRILKSILATSTLSFAITAPASASTPITLGFSKPIAYAGDVTSIFKKTKQILGPDGNLYTSTASSFSSYQVATLRKYAPTGDLIWARDISFIGSLNSFDVNSTGVAILAKSEELPNQHVTMAKLDLNGNLLWTSTCNFSSDPIAAHCETDGRSRFIVNVPGAIPLNDHFEVLTCTSTGVTTSGYTSVGSVAKNASFSQDGHVAVGGYSSDGTGATFMLLDPSLKSVLQLSDKTSSSHSAFFALATDPNGNFHVSDASYDPNGVLASSSSLFTCDPKGNILNAVVLPGLYAFQITAASADSYYAEGEDGVKELHDYLIHVQGNAIKWNKTFDPATRSEMQLVADGQSGVLLVGLDTSVRLDKYTTDGLLDWSARPSSPKGFAIYATKPITSNSTVYYWATSVAKSLNQIQFCSYVEGQGLNSVTVPSPKAAGDSSFTGSVNLNVSGPKSNNVKLVSSNPALLAIPSIVNLPANTKSAGYLAFTAPVDAITPVTISATLGAVVRTSTVSLQPAALTALTLGRSGAQAGSTISGSVVLDGPTSIQGRTVKLTSSNPAVAQVPDSVFIQPFTNSATFTVQTFAGKTGQVTLFATALGITSSQPLAVTP